MLFPLMVALSLVQLLQVCADPHIVYKTKNIECLPDPKYAVNSTCYVKALNWNKAVAQMDCYLVQPLRNTSIQLQLFKRGYSNQYHPFLINFMVNMCDVIAKRNFLIYGTMLWKLIRQYTNVNHSCPFTGHMMARNLYIDENIGPIFPLAFTSLPQIYTKTLPNGPVNRSALLTFMFRPWKW